VIAKPLANGTTGFYFTVPTRYRKMGCTIPNEPLGLDYGTACGADGRGGRAAALNGLFDEWWKGKNGEPAQSIARYGTVIGSSGNTKPVSDTASACRCGRGPTMSG
jgi:hypothetical protein